MATKKSTKSESPVAARDELEALNADSSEDAQREQLEEQAKEQEKAQAESLKAGANIPAKDADNIAAARAPVGKGGNGVQGGLVDQMTRRDVSDVMEGQFCTVDRTHKDVDENMLPAGEDGYGIYRGPATTDEHGYPVTAQVDLRDSSFASITVPYEALRPVSEFRRR